MTGGVLRGTGEPGARPTRRAVLGLSAGLPLLGFARRPSPAGRPWWKDAIVYEIYPRSFQDGNGDGIGDFAGMARRVDYLAELGIDAVWVAACFDSPNADNGYDVRDYRRIMPDFGTMADFDRFAARARARGIRIILDMVFNHTSDEHRWFEQSRSSRDNPYRDFYIWRDGRDGDPPTNWREVLGGGGSAWQLDARTGQYYLHTFTARQPDLNWANPRVREELYAVLRFWAAKGVSGFRFDAITSIAKPVAFVDLSVERIASGNLSFADRGATFNGYLREMHDRVFAGTDLYGVGEAWGLDPAGIAAATGAGRGELSSAFRFELQLADIDDWRKSPVSLDRIRAFNRDNAFDDRPDIWPLVFLEDHDFPRAVSRYGSSRPEWRARSAKLLGTMLLTLRGTPYLYQGQELGMANYPFTTIEQYDDVAAHNAWRDQVLGGKVDAETFLVNLAQSSRDNARTPMQWEAGEHAGFTAAAKPWLAVNPDYPEVNVAIERGAADSVLNHYRALIRLRKATPALREGGYADLSPADSSLYVYRRGLPGDAVVVVLNFGDEPALWHPEGDKAYAVLLSNLPDIRRGADGTVTLRPWEAMILRA